MTNIERFDNEMKVIITNTNDEGIIQSIETIEYDISTGEKCEFYTLWSHKTIDLRRRDKNNEVIDELRINSMGTNMDYHIYDRFIQNLSLNEKGAKAKLLELNVPFNSNNSLKELSKLGSPSLKIFGATMKHKINSNGFHTFTAEATSQFFNYWKHFKSELKEMGFSCWKWEEKDIFYMRFTSETRDIDIDLSNLDSEMGVKKELAAKEKESEYGHFYNNGDKLTLGLTLKRKGGFDSFYGYTSIDAYIDENGNTLIYKGSNPPNLKNDSEVCSFTIKHSEYNGNKQTLIQRVVTASTKLEKKVRRDVTKMMKKCFEMSPALDPNYFDNYIKKQGINNSYLIEGIVAKEGYKYLRGFIVEKNSEEGRNFIIQYYNIKIAC